eukprot:7272447-Heterocapsa_arctica.AAC.1
MRLMASSSASAGTALAWAAGAAPMLLDAAAAQRRPNLPTSWRGQLLTGGQGSQRWHTPHPRRKPAPRARQ